jgi:hypothetical protein
MKGPTTSTERFHTLAETLVVVYLSKPRVTLMAVNNSEVARGVHGGRAGKEWRLAAVGLKVLYYMAKGLDFCSSHTQGSVSVSAIWLLAGLHGRKYQD